MDNTHPSDMTNKKSRNQTKKVPVLEKKSIPIRQKKTRGGIVPMQHKFNKEIRWLYTWIAYITQFRLRMYYVPKCNKEIRGLDCVH